MAARDVLGRLAALGGLLFCFGAAQADIHTIPLFVPAGGPGSPQGMLRIVNRADEPGTVRVHALDDAGRRTGPAVFTLGASAAVELTAEDLLSGNPAKALSGGVGVGDAVTRLEVETHLDIVPLAFVRAADGTLSAVHDTVGASAASVPGRHVYDVPVFHSAGDAAQSSRLRLINPGDVPAALTIRGTDDDRYAAGGEVSLTLAAGGARTLTAEQLEIGDGGLDGWLGAGSGRWRLTVAADRPLQVVNVAVGATGYWSNLSTAPGLAPGNRTSFDARFGAGSIFYRGGDRLATFALRPFGRFTETKESAGASETHAGRYEYEPAGPGAGRLAARYEDGTACTVNLYFDARDAGWFASRCVGVGIGDTVSRWGGTWSARVLRGLSGPQGGRFDLDGANRAPAGIAWSGGRLHVVDRARAKVFAYGVEGYLYAPPEGLRHRSFDFGLHADNARPAGIAWADGRLHVLDEGVRKVFAYGTRGRRENARDFDLDPDNARASGIIGADGVFYVLDRGSRKVFVYGAGGRGEPATAWQLAAGNGDPSAIAWQDGRIFVVDTAGRKVHAYRAGGDRDPGSDFGLYADNADPAGIVWADERFRVVDATTQRVYSYGGPAADGG
ncbi:MAG: hypothetical protein OXQ29_07855 [Rhodospirillaceae bacterium]|nr:hypothetical protein [Rhodospirillaceae bacterium]